MTNNPTIDGVSRELLQKVDDLLYIMTGHDSHPKMIRKYGEEFWKPLEAMRAEICTTLAAPVVERQPLPKVGRFFPEGYSVVRQGDHSASVEWSGVCMSFSENEPDGCMGQLVDFLRVLIDVDPPEIAALQSTIAQLQARVQELESGRGEPVAYQWRCKTVNDGSQWRHWVDCTEEDYNKTIENPGPTSRGIIREARKLYTAPPDPVAVVLPERKPDINRSFEGTDAEWYGNIAWNACLDATAALNTVHVGELDPAQRLALARGTDHD